MEKSFASQRLTHDSSQHSHTNATSANLSGLALNTTYFWHVRSVNASGTTYANGFATTFWRFTTQVSAMTPN